MGPDRPPSRPAILLVGRVHGVRVSKCPRSTDCCRNLTSLCVTSAGSRRPPSELWPPPSRRPWLPTRSSGCSFGFVEFASRAHSKRAFRSSASGCSSGPPRRSSSGCRGLPGDSEAARGRSRRRNWGRSGWRWTCAPSLCPTAGSLLVTETRVAGVDARGRRSFRRYWRLVGPFSVLIRRRWLAAIARTASRDLSGV
jgi:hypothetical protein